MKSTLNKDLIEPYRRCGNTTRQVDYAVQLLFSGEDVKVEDHYEYGTHTQANHDLFNLIRFRVENEHGIGLFYFNEQNLTIAWKQ